MSKKDIHANRLESVIFDMQMYILQKKTKCKGGLNFEGLEMQKENMPTDRA